MKKQSLVRGALVLTIAALITKVLGFAISIILSRVLGPEGIGLIMLVIPLAGLMITLTTLGLPTAISILVAEAEAQNDETKVKKILQLSLAITSSLSVLLVIGAVLFGKTFASHFLTDQRSYYSLMALIPIIPIVAISGVLKGYFRGKQNMNPLAISEVIEQTIQISFIVLLVHWLLPYGLEFAAAGAIISSIIGEGASLIFLIVLFKISTRKEFQLPFNLWKHVANGRAIITELFKTGLPTTGSGFIFSISHAIQPILITKSLAAAGIGSVLITKQYGMLTGFVMPLLFLPSFINHPLQTAMVPAISEANASQNTRLIHNRIEQAVRISLIIGVHSTMILYLYSDQLMTVVYHAPEAAPLLKVIAPFFLFQYLQTPYESALVGLGHAKAVMLNNLIAKCVTLLLIYPLAANLSYGIYGVLLAISTGVVLETFLHIVSAIKLIGLYIKHWDLIKVGFASAITGITGVIIFSQIQNIHFDLLSSTFISILSSLVLYMFLLIYLKIIRLDVTKVVPYVRKTVK